MRVFIDTSLWVYRLDRRAPDKSLRASRWLRSVAETHEVVVSMQVMIELRAVLTHRLKPALSAHDVGAVLAVLAAFEVTCTYAGTVLDAHELAKAEQLPWLDALIAEAALRSHREVLYSEDFGHGRKLGGKLLVQNPLRAA